MGASDSAVQVAPTNETYTFLDEWIFPYQVPKKIFTENSMQFTRNIFRNTVHESRQKTIAHNRLPPTWHSEQCSKTIATWLHRYVAVSWQMDSIFAQRLIYAYTRKGQRTNNITPFILFLPRNLSRPGSLYNSCAIFLDTYYTRNPRALHAQLVTRINTYRVQINTSLTSDQNQYKREKDNNIISVPSFVPV